MDGQSVFIFGNAAATLLAGFGVWQAWRGRERQDRVRGVLMVVAAVVIAGNVWLNSLPLPPPPPPPAKTSV